MAKQDDNDNVFKVRAKVVAAVDLPGVPAGTPGKVTLKNGFRWTRYRVYFDNGEDIGSLDGTQLMARKEWDKRPAPATAG